LAGSLARAAIVALATTALNAAAHDTWFAPLPAPKSNQVLLALGTGNQFPVQESAVGIEHLARSGCREIDGRVTALKFARDTDTALVLSTATRQPLTCWAQLAPHEVELAADKIALYFKEIQAPAELREQWRQMQARGLPWRERYTKHARIDWAIAGSPPVPAGASDGPDMAPDMALDIRLDRAAAGRPVQAGEALIFQVIRDGQPLPGLALELRGDNSRFGIWRRTDADGRVRLTAPPAGRWVLRGTDLRLSASNPDEWESRFVTLAFEVSARDAQNPSSSSSNARSANQTAASAAISSEPPIITSRR
jgi:Domain of unknown function (DUF4198)